MNIVYVNGKYARKEQASISIFDRGFLFSDSVYEVIPFESNKGIGLDEHLNRLDQSLIKAGIPNPINHSGWKAIFNQLIELNQLNNKTFNFYLQITRGTEEYVRNHLPKTKILKPNVICFCQGNISSKQRMYFNNGLHLITLEDPRRRDCDIKSTSLLPSILSQQCAKRKSADDVIFVGNNVIRESSSSNIFIVKNNTLITPIANNNILNGITRQLILKLAQQNNIASIERDITENELYTADEIFLSSCVKEITPVRKVNETVINQKTQYPLWKTINNLYQDYKRTHTLATIEE